MKLVTTAHALPVASSMSSTNEEDDMVAYERNVKALVDEYSRRQTNHSHMYQLMKLTFKVRRDRISSSLLPTTDLKEEYPYLGSKKWVSAWHLFFDVLWYVVTSSTFTLHQLMQEPFHPSI